MPIGHDSSAEEVFDFLAQRCPQLTKTYPEEIFRGIDGQVFLGLTPGSIDMIFPQLSLRDKGLLLARVEALRQEATPSPPLPPTRLYLPAPTVDDTRPIGRLDEGRFQSLYKHDFPPTSPSKRMTASQNEENVHSSIAPILGDLPRILIELWRATDDPDKDEFLAESWLPEMTEIERKSQTIRLGLRRSVQRKSDLKIVATRAWLGALIVTTRYHRIGNKLELLISEAKELNVATHAFSEFFIRVYTYMDSGPKKQPVLRTVHETPRRGLTSGSSCVLFQEEICVTFGRSDDTSIEKKPFNFVSPKRPEPVGLDSAQSLKDIMLRDPLKTKEGLVCLFDLLTFAGKNYWEKFNPRINRFEAYLLPTHEISALFGSQYTLKSMAQIDLLKHDPDYMRSHLQVVELLITAWSPSVAGQSWLFRHALLSCILVENREGVKELLKISKSFLQDRQLEISEDGFGEAVFSLENDLEAARAFWGAPTRRSGIRSPFLPGQRVPLGQLLEWQ